ncbi:MAG: phosphoribosylglycinamide formyltransferase [Armatimonadota bacterium]
MSSEPVRIGVLASGGGSNMQAVMDAINAGRINGRIVLVIGDRPTAFALERARGAGIETAVISPKNFPTRVEFSQALADRLREAEVGLVVLAGFMFITTAELTDAFAGRMINIHPALIPAFCGKGFYGHHVHEAVLAYGVKVSGCTVHFVELDADAGPIILQRVVPVQEDDTPETLAARVLVEEHKAMPEAVRLFCAGRLRIDGRVVRVLPTAEMEEEPVEG